MGEPPKPDDEEAGGGEAPGLKFRQVVNWCVTVEIVIILLKNLTKQRVFITLTST